VDKKYGTLAGGCDVINKRTKEKGIWDMGYFERAVISNGYFEGTVTSKIPTKVLSFIIFSMIFY
jgi:hypothetical protein